MKSDSCIPGFLIETPFEELRARIGRAAVPAELHGCFKAIERGGKAMSGAERVVLRGLITRKFAEWNVAAVGVQAPRW